MVHENHSINNQWNICEEQLMPYFPTIQEWIASLSIFEAQHILLYSEHFHPTTKGFVATEKEKAHIYIDISFSTRSYNKSKLKYLVATKKSIQQVSIIEFSDLIRRSKYPSLNQLQAWDALKLFRSLQSNCQHKNSQWLLDTFFSKLAYNKEYVFSHSLKRDTRYETINDRRLLNMFRTRIKQKYT